MDARKGEPWTAIQVVMMPSDANPVPILLPRDTQFQAAATPAIGELSVCKQHKQRKGLSGESLPLYPILYEAAKRR